MELHLTPSALAAAKRDLRGDQRLRIAFAGGCGAMGFRLAAVRRAAEGDRELAIDGVAVLVDRQAAAELDGAAVDYDEEEGFTLDHPAWGVQC